MPTFPEKRIENQPRVEPIPGQEQPESGSVRAEQSFHTDAEMAALREKMNEIVQPKTETKSGEHNEVPNHPLRSEIPEADLHAEVEKLINTSNKLDPKLGSDWPSKYAEAVGDLTTPEEPPK